MSILGKLVKYNNNGVVCDLCGTMIEIYFRFLEDPLYMSIHIAKHFATHSQNRFFNVSFGNVPCLVFENAKLHTREVYSINREELEAFPQFVFIHPIENIEPIRNISHLVDVDEGNSITSIKNILCQLDYCCNICGDHFENGIPSIEMISKHIKECYMGRR